MKDRCCISAIRPVAELGQSVAGDIISEPIQKKDCASCLEECFENMATPFYNKRML